MPREVIATPIAFVLLCLALFVHRRWRAFLPEDPPGPRKEQTRPLPAVGHLLALPALPVLLLRDAPPAFVAAFALVALVGWNDDRTKARGGMRWQWKALLFAGACWLAGDALTLPASERALRCAFLFVITNALNFLDNMNGVAVAVAAVPLLLADPSDPIAWACVGFLPLNWPKARAILGDAGALPIGLWLGWRALQQPALPATLALTALPLVDFVQVVCARVWLGYAPWIGDRRHITHIASNLGVPRVLIAPGCAVVAGGVWLAVV